MKALELARERARLNNYLRDFFEAQGVLEVETPLLYPFTTSEAFIDSFEVSIGSSTEKSSLFLQSSPEFCMKRLLSRTETSIYQLCKAFRKEEKSPRHLIEFTMLEWYMKDWRLEQLMEQVEALLKPLLKFDESLCLSYSEIFSDLFHINPHVESLDSLRVLVQQECHAVKVENFSRDECLHLLFADKIEKNLDKKKLVFIHDFPASQSALAKVDTDKEGMEVAKRFEVFFGGMELANAYQEETSAGKLGNRFSEDNKIRQQLGKERVNFDDKLLGDMETNFPECAGIALGIDRLLMLVLGKETIGEVVFFQEEKS